MADRWPPASPHKPVRQNTNRPSNPGSSPNVGNASGIRTALPEHPTTNLPPAQVEHDPPTTCDSLQDDQRISSRHHWPNTSKRSIVGATLPARMEVQRSVLFLRCRGTPSGGGPVSRGRGGDRVHPSGSGPVPTSGGCSISHRRGAAYAFARPAAAPWVPVRGRPRGPLCGVGSVYPRPVTVNIWEGVSHAMYQSPFASPLRCMHASMFTAFADAS